MSKDIHRVKLTYQQLQEWDDTRAALLWYCPSLTHVFYTLMNKDENYIVVATDSDDLIPVAATDGECVVINPKRYFAHTLLERLFILAHEILHNLLDHIRLLYRLHKAGKVVLSSGRKLPFNEELMQMALDYVVNAILVDGKIGQLPKTALFDLKIATHLDSVLDVYEKLFNSSGGGKGRKSSQGQPPPQGYRFDVHLDPGSVEGKPASEAMAQRNETEWSTVIAAAIEAGLAQGKLPAGLKRVFEKVIETKIDWTDHIQAFYARKVTGGSVNWRKPDRKLIVRDIWAPSRSGYGSELVILANDTSGSITPATMNKWYGAQREILEQVNPRRLLLIWCDAEVGQVDELEDVSDLENVMRKGAPGGGGTRFEPVFDYIWEHRLEPDALVYLTDGYGSFPRRAPSYPVLWGSIALEPKHYPFGDVVMLPKD